MEIKKIFDIHIYFGKSLFKKDWQLQSLQQLERKYPQLEGCLLPVKPYDYLYGPANATIARLTADNRKWSHTLRVDPWRLSESIALLEKTQAAILFIHPFEEQIYPGHSHIAQLLDLAAAKKMHIMLAGGYLPFSHPAQLLPLIRDFANLRFIVTHGGQINICGLHMEEAFAIFEQCPNTYFETSGIYREDFIERAVDKLGENRVVFGSGTPVYDLDFELKRIEYLKIKSSAKEQILYHNSRELLQ